MIIDEPALDSSVLYDYGHRVMKGVRALEQTDATTRPETITQLLDLFEELRKDADGMWAAAARVLAQRVRSRLSAHATLIRASDASALVQKALTLDELGKGG